MADRPHALHSASPEELKARLEAERAGEPFLVYRDGDGIQRLLTLDAGVARVSVGRRPEADLALTWDSEVSRLHAVLERVAGEWTVVDDGLSANGTFAGADRISGRRRLAEGDALRFGRTVVTFRDPLDLGNGATRRAATWPWWRASRPPSARCSSRSAARSPVEPGSPARRRTRTSRPRSS